MGADKAIDAKANADIRKRNSQPKHLRANTTYCFVTPRRWHKKRDWQKEHAGDGWRGIQVIDADNLEHWLEAAPVVAAWFASLLGLPVEHIVDVETALEAWRKRTAPSIPKSALVAGRTEAVTLVHAVLDGPPVVLQICAETRSEAVAFLGAAIANEERHRDRCLVVRNRSAWEQMCAQKSPLVLNEAAFGGSCLCASVSLGRPAAARVR